MAAVSAASEPSGPTRVSRRGFLLRAAAGWGAVAAGLLVLRRVLLPGQLGAEGAATLTAWLDTLLPRGELPGHRGTGVQARLAAELGASRLGRRALVEGTAHLERAARERGARRFAELPESVRAEIVEAMAAAPPGSLPAYAYRVVRDRAMELHYAQPAAWRPLGLPHPPQPDGYPDYAEAPRG